MINDAVKEKLNDDKLINARRKNIFKLKKLFSGEYPSEVFLLDGIYGTAESSITEEPEKWVCEVLEALAGNAGRMLDENVFRPLCLECNIYGVHFIDKILGADVFFRDGQWYNRYLDTPVGKLVYPDMDQNETWQLAKRAASFFASQNVTVPFFGLPTIASALNIAINLYGENILLELGDDPDCALHDLKVINTLLCEIHKWYLDNLPLEQLQPVVSGHRTQPPGFGQLCGCSTQLISPSMYKDYIAPLDDELLSVYPNGGMIHLCGSHTQHIRAWREMKSLRAVQVNDRAAMDLESYFNGLRADQAIYFSPCEGISIEQALHITKGHRLVVAHSFGRTQHSLHSQL